MKSVPVEVYKRIDNDIYDLEGDKWWQPEFSLHLIRAVLNPFRVGYAKRIINQLHMAIPHSTALEVGCGGGILTEEIAAMGFATTGIDPAEQSLTSAKRHATDTNLSIVYDRGSGEDLPYQNCSFDVVFCCDVLEHVRDAPKVISEISRVLRSGGLFIYDTFNRTILSNICMIKMLQEWKYWAILPPGLHVWEMFSTPDEIRSYLRESNLDWKEHRGAKPNISSLALLRYLHKSATGELSYEDFGSKFHIVESSCTEVMYIGYAIKK